MSAIVTGPGSLSDPITVDTVKAVLEDMGYATRIERQDNNTVLLHNKINGLKTVTFLALRDGEGDAVDSLQFFLGLSPMDRVGQAAVNQWNQERRFAKAFLDPDGNFSFVMDVLVFGDGVNRAYIESVANLWLSLLNTLFDYLRDKTTN
jgi:hypothetical protein